MDLHPLSGRGVRRTERNLGVGVRAPPARGAMRRRRWFVGGAKRLLPLVAAALLVLVVLWPEIGRQADRARLSWQVLRGTTEIGQLSNATYHGVNEQGQPYTVTAIAAHQTGQDRVDMTNPVGDLNADGGWSTARSDVGVYMQKLGQLDLSGNVTLYRNDGTVLSTDTASLDVHEGAAAGSAQTHVEGPFGTIDAQGFSLFDHGGIIRFTGPSRMVLYGSGK